MKKLLLCLPLLLTLLVSGCQAPPIAQPNVNDNGANLDSIGKTIKGNDEFGLNLYTKYKTKDGNIFFSPYSISSALAMTYEGAKGQTAAEMQKVFGFLADPTDRRSSFAKIYNDLNAKNEDYQLNTANALWVQKDFPFLADYLNLVEKYYGGKATNLDFINQTEQSRQTINQWVEKKTNNKIQNLLPQGSVSGDTRLILTNAVYFKGTWLFPFEKSSTQKKDFQLTPTNTVTVDMMQLYGKKFNYSETNKLQALEIPYKGDKISMLILLPKNNDLAYLENNLNLKNLNEWKTSMNSEKVTVFLPKYKFDTKYDMAQDLTQLGMPTAFNCSLADFSGMTGKTDLCIDQVIHKAFIEVDEQGTEAAAATAVIMKTSMAGPTQPEKIYFFNADHPFIFLIQDKQSGNILFLGRVSDPTK
ncbi:MAG: serpin family protein [Patescibacteria group bacterium]|jgi:serpin B